MSTVEQDAAQDSAAKTPATNTPTQATDRYRANYQGEVESAALYRALAENEDRPQLAKVYERLASVEEAHADFWKKRIAALNERAPTGRLGWRIRALIWLAQRFGADAVLPTAVRLEGMGGDNYATQPEAAARGMPAQEQSHARILTALSSRKLTGGVEGGVLAQLEGRHGQVGANALRAAVLGANDGLVSNLSLVMGVSGAALSNDIVLITGLAGLIAGAASMAMGEWLSVQSSRELYQKQIATEASELELMPEEEKQELELIYQAKGLSEPEAKALADRMLSDKDRALDTLVREELGIDPEQLGGSAWAAASASFLLFCLGAIIPVFPFLFVEGINAIAASVALSTVALFVIGGLTSLFTAKPVWFAGLRQLVIGLAAAAVTFGVGHLLGVSVG
ncbi:MAG TPA: VIT1/CCC1 transporter family protein [Alphaproteobacteria bacterium]